jgi:hypothetical protein
MKQLAAFISLLSPLALCAQITIGQSDMPSPGDTIRYQNSTFTGYDVTITGAAQEWHFEGLVPAGEAADTIVSVESTPFLYQFFFNNPFFYPDWNADHALRGASFNFQVAQVQDLYDYYKVTSSGFLNVGFGATVNALPVSVQRDPIDEIYQFPLEFGNTSSGPSHFVISVPTLGTLGQDQVRTNEVDGWGTVYLPADTFEVLRVKSVLQRTDTIYIDQFGIGFTLPEPETIEYKWLAVGMDQPVLQVTTLAGIPTLVRFFYQPDDISTGSGHEVSFVAPVLFPNPAHDRVRIAADHARVLEVLDAQGRLVRSVAVPVGQREASLDVSTLPAGVYAVRRLGEVAATRLMVAH